MKLWQWWIVVVAALSGPWFGIVGHPQWERATWVPFHGAEDKPRDIVANLLMYVPFGWSFAATRRGPRGVLLALGASLAVSVAVEAPQLFYRFRDPSATDVFMAICGGGVGSLASQAFYGRDARGTPRGREARQAGGQQ